MAKKNPAPANKKPATSSRSKSTPVRNTAIPKVKKAAAAAAPAVVITSEMIAKRAYEIYASGTGGSEQDNWFRAERELRAGL